MDSPTILVVEDDAALREAITDTLELANYQCLHADNGESALLDLRTRYYQAGEEEGVPLREENFKRRQVNMKLPVHQTALILVDVWKSGSIDSVMERTESTIKNSIVPVLDEAHKIGMPVIHAPKPIVAIKFKRCQRLCTPDDLRYIENAINKGVNPKTSSDWPPTDFVNRSGEYHQFRHGRNRHPKWRPIDYQFSPYIDVHDNDFVIANARQLQEVLSNNGILHLIYAGFATNVCMLNRDYGIRAMYQRAYNIIILRDATTGIEYPDTLQNLMVTEIAIREVEQHFGFSASNEDFFKASQGLNSG